MGNYDYNNYLAVIKVRDNIMDSVFLDYCISTDMAFSSKEYDAFLDAHPTATHPVAVKALDFVCNYKGGRLKPDKWGAWDPLREIFDDEAPQKFITSLTRHGGSIDIRKNRLYSAEFINRWYTPIWEGSGKKAKPLLLSERKRVLPEYMFCIQFYFSKSLKNIYPFIEELVVDFCEALNTDYGQILDQSTNEKLFDISDRR